MELFAAEYGFSLKETGKLTRLQTHLYLVKLVQRKQLENEANAPPEDGKKRGRADFEEWDDGDEGDLIDGEEAFLAMFPE